MRVPSLNPQPTGEGLPTEAGRGEGRGGAVHKASLSRRQTRMWKETEREREERAPGILWACPVEEGRGSNRGPRVKMDAREAGLETTRNRKQLVRYGQTGFKRERDQFT